MGSTGDLYTDPCKLTPPVKPALRTLLPLAAVIPSLTASGMSIVLFEHVVLRDGVADTTLPAGSSFDLSQGLGTVRMSFSTPGTHWGGLYVDHELSETLNTYFNEVGSVSGVPATGLTWEIDEPGFVFGDIYDNFLNASLDSSIGTASPDDVSMAMIWNFDLSPGQSALLEFVLATDQPVGFHLRHADPDSGESVYFSSALTIRSNPVGVPDSQTPAAIMLLATCLGLGIWRSRRSPAQ